MIYFSKYQIYNNCYSLASVWAACGVNGVLDYLLFHICKQWFSNYCQYFATNLQVEFTYHVNVHLVCKVVIYSRFTDKIQTINILWKKENFSCVHVVEQSVKVYVYHINDYDSSSIRNDISKSKSIAIK